MWLLTLEATGAFFIFIFIVWWTMFSGRKPEAPAVGKDEDTATGPDTRP